MKNDNLISAQPLIHEGKLISHNTGKWNETEFNEHKEVIVGYYHVLCRDMKEAIEIANLTKLYSSFSEPLSLFFAFIF